jgi:ferrous iron transport protein B
VIIALGVLFWVTYSVAGPASSALSDLITEDLAGLVARALAWAPDWVSGVIVEGAIGGAGTVLSFVPILIIFFAALGLLEDVGYMARTAYVMDRYMHWMGLHGKSCMPLLLGFGCNVPAILGTRIIEDRRNRMLTMLLTPFVPCTGRLAVLAFLTPAFFGARAPLAIIALVGGNLVLIALVGIAVNKLVFKGERSAFIMEMPLYHRPNARTIGLYVWRNIVAFVKKAGTLIVIVSALVWLLANFPGDDPSESILGTIGRFFEPGGALMGLCDWRLIVALISCAHPCGRGRLPGGADDFRPLRGYGGGVQAGVALLGVDGGQRRADARDRRRSGHRGIPGGAPAVAYTSTINVRVVRPQEDTYANLHRRRVLRQR